MMGPWDPFDDVASPPVNPDLPPIVLLAGFLGLDLARGDGARVWLTPGSFVLGDVARDLTLGPSAPALYPAGLNRVVYGDLVRGLRRAGFAVHAFNFDFRRSVIDVAVELRAALDAIGPMRPAVFVSHSMGALVNAVYPRVDPAWRSRMDRAIFLGGPLGGTFEVVEAALGKHPIIRRLSTLSLLDDSADFAACMRTWPGLYDLLPDPDLFARGEDAFDAGAWPAGMRPSPLLLKAARETRRMVNTSPLFSIPCAQILSLRFGTVDGYSPGPVGPGPRGAPGDGTVSARTAGFGGVELYRVESPHTLLPVDPAAIAGVIEIAATGATGLPRVGAAEVALARVTAEPTLEEITAAYTGMAVGQAARGLFDLQDLCWLLAPRGWC